MAHHDVESTLVGILEMQLPFTNEQFFEVLRAYNTGVWPAQVVLLLVAVLALVAVWRRRMWSGVVVCVALSVLWAWLALAYHIAFFARINPLAYLFGAVSLLGSVLFLWLGVVRREVQFSFERNLRTFAGLAMVGFALVIYPLWLTLTGHAYPEFPTFGLPCPTTIFTIGLLACSRGPRARILLVVPFLWSLVGGQAAYLLAVEPDFALFVAAAVAAALFFALRRTPE